MPEQEQQPTERTCVREREGVRGGTTGAAAAPPLPPPPPRGRERNEGMDQLAFLTPGTATAL